MRRPSIDGNRIGLLPVGLTTAPSDFIFKRYFDGPNAENRIPSILLVGSTGARYSSGVTPWNNSANSYQIRDDVSWTKDHTSSGWAEAGCLSRSCKIALKPPRAASSLLAFLRETILPTTCLVTRQPIQRRPLRGGRALEQRFNFRVFPGELARYQPAHIKSGHSMGQHSAHV